MTTPNTPIDGLINSLLTKTREGRVPWFATASTLEFSVAFSSSSVTIRSVPMHPIPDFILSIQNADGEEIESCTARFRHDPHYSLLEEMFGLARRKASAIDETIARIQAELTDV